MLLSDLSISLVIATTLFSSAQALGINCRGSFYCSTAGIAGDIHGVRGAIAQLMVNGHKDKHYAQGQQLGCSDHLCAFYQSLPGGENVQVAWDKVNDLIDHGCSLCGSCPTKPGNDVSTGQLTLNYVEDPCCEGKSCYCL